MRKILLAAVAVTPLFGGVALANISHTNTDPGDIQGPQVLYMGNEAQYFGGTPQQQHDFAQRQRQSQPQQNPNGETSHPVTQPQG